MASKTDHVLHRDGSARRGGPRPDPPTQPAKEAEEVSDAVGFPEGA